MKRIISLSIIFVFIAFAFTYSLIANAVASDYKATANVDSTTMMAGSQTTLDVDFSGPLMPNSRITIATEEMNPEMEITSQRNSSLSDIGNNRKELKESFTVQVFDSGLYTVPPILCISGEDTIICNSPAIRVDPFPLDTANLVMTDSVVSDFKIHDYSDVAVAEKKFLDFMPDWVMDYFWWIVIAIIIIAVAVFVYMKWLRHGKIPLIPVKKPIPPYELAINRLSSLQDQMLWQKGAEKEYYTELTDILRTYLEGRFGINAMEMTTPQIMDAISNNEGISEYTSLINAVLMQADFVKFAKARPLADENQRAFGNVRQFVEVTKPVVEEKPENDEQSSEKSKEADGHIRSKTDNKDSETNNVTK